MARPQKHHGRWRIRWVDPVDGTRRSRSFESYSVAERALHRVRSQSDEIRVGLRRPPQPDRTFSDLCAYWLEHRAVRKKDPKDDESIIRKQLQPFFGHLPLPQVTLERVDAFRRLRCPRERDEPNAARPPLSSGLISVKTLHNHLTLLISMLNLAVELGWLSHRPRIRKPKLMRPTFAFIQTQADIDSFLSAARLQAPGIFELYTTAIYTGLRAGELCGLRWSDIDLDRRLITVQRSYETTTKTDEIRHVPILDPLLPVLRRWRLSCPSPTIPFPNETLGHHGPSARVLQETLQRTRVRAGIPYRFTFHSLRHTFASHWMMRGGDIYRLQRILGHKSIQMTERYSHLAPDAFSSEYGRLGSLPPLAESPPRLLPFPAPPRSSP